MNGEEIEERKGDKYGERGGETLAISDDGKDHSIVDRHVDNSASVIKLQIEKEKEKEKEKVPDARLLLFLMILISGCFSQANQFLLSSLISRASQINCDRREKEHTDAHFFLATPHQLKCKPMILFACLVCSEMRCRFFARSRFSTRSRQIQNSLT